MPLEPDRHAGEIDDLVSDVLDRDALRLSQKHVRP